MASSSGAGEQQQQQVGVVVPWVEKYRPQTLEDVAAHKEIVETVTRLTDMNKLPHLLLYGPPGTGKTSMILAIAKKMYGKRAAQMCLHLNASDARGIDVVRNDIQGFASTRNISFAFRKPDSSSGSAQDEFKLVILDECDAMTNDAQFALRRIIEKYTKNTRFCLICNYVNKVIPALQSRCTRFRFCPLPAEYVRARLLHVMEKEGVSTGEEGGDAMQVDGEGEGEGEGVDAVVRLSKGDMRRALNLVQTMSMSGKRVTAAEVYACTGQTAPGRVREVLKTLLNAPFAECIGELERAQNENGFALVDLLQDLHAELKRVALPSEVRCELLSTMADLENNLSAHSTEKLQLGGLVGCFAIARKHIVEQAA